MYERVAFQTDDGVTIVGNYFRGEPSRPIALLLHMMPATKESWTALAEALADVGWSAVAIDLRGHGESKTAGDRQLDHKEFTNADHQAKMTDIEAAVDWLEKNHGAKKSRLALVGASIGANLAISYAAAHNEIPAVVALSPGLDYRGVTTIDKIAAMKPAQKVMLAASAEDELAFETNQELRKKKKGTVTREFNGLGHGTAMLVRNPPFITEIVAWLTSNVS